MPDRPITNIDVTWTGGFRFTSKDAYGHSVTLDAPMEDGDSFEGYQAR